MRPLDRRALLCGLMAAPLLAHTAAADVLALSRRPLAKPLPTPKRLISASGLRGRVAYTLMDPADGRQISEDMGHAPMPPASVMKAVTALYALDRLGPAHRFRTRVLRAGDMLILAGGGDPVLSTDDLARLAKELVATGQTTPKRFAVWGGALPGIEEIAPEQADYLAYNPALSGMILNFNRVHLGWRRANGALQMSLEARAAAHSPRAYSITAAATDQNDLFAYRDEGEREAWTVSRAAVARPGSRWLPVRKPELYAGDVFQTLCRAEGLPLPAPEIIATLPAAEEVAALASPPLSVILRDMLYFSTNLTAEVVGLHASGARTPSASALDMQAWVKSRVPGQNFELHDHSGLSAASRITPRGMATLLAGPGLASQLPGLLKTKPLAEDLGQDSGVGSRVMAKTGTLNFVSNLAGYLQTTDGQHRAFAIFCSDPPRHAATTGQELPAGVQSWTHRAKLLQQDLLRMWDAGTV
jgi:D-alanyl-D-alanine carboxypeptidase/D-alanyl-D-alanine-endopeptidase (penicillin-binding protein 4)